ncbi:MAG TPA: rhamnogalacturonan acetylesterase [Candidatus Acidoferrum sp.]|nr:rhamnogalacturonan acetylesterase [Candidatus Acidoferrum sp.]
MRTWIEVTAALLFCVVANAQQSGTPTIWVVGDSTANNLSHRGWADPFADYFDSAKAQVANRTRAGRNSRTFITEGLWEKVRAEIKPGDWVLIQFGHNDGGPPDQDRARGSLPGLGAESQDFTLPNGARETVYTFGHYMRRMVAEAKEAGAHPVLLSLTVRNIWKDGKVERGSGRFSEWTGEIAKAAGVPFLDVMNAIADQYDQLGEAKVKPWFPEDHTHTSPEGAAFNAQIVVAAIKGANLPLAAMLSITPRNPALPNLLLIGD